MPRNKKLGGERWSWAVMSPLPESELSKATILDFFSWALPLRSPEQNYRSLPLDPKPIVVRTGQDKFVDNVKVGMGRLWMRIYETEKYTEAGAGLAAVSGVPGVAVAWRCGVRADEERAEGRGATDGFPRNPVSHFHE